MGAKATYIPEEIVLNILPHLPAHSLLRFRCVTKKWCSWITKGRKFIIKSGYVSYNYDDDYNKSINLKCPCSIQSIDQTTGEIEDLSHDIPWESNHVIEIYGSCNGLLLIGYYDDLFIWNPSLGGGGCNNMKKLFSYSQLSYNNRIVGGLCFDTVTNEYKIVLALDPCYGGEFVAVGSPRNRTWTRIRFPYDVGDVYSGPVLNNRLHWYVSSCSDNALLYFDTKIDEFVELPMPPRLGMRKGKLDGIVKCGLGVLDGCLCMTRPEGGYEGDTFEVLGMMAYGVKESWSILFRIKGVRFWDGVVPLFFVGNQRGKVLFKAMNHPRGDIIIYDTVAESRTDVTSAEYMGSGVVYEETLVKPVGYGWEELYSRGEASYVEIIDSGTSFWPKRKCTRTVERDDCGFWRTVKEDWIESKEDRKCL